MIVFWVTLLLLHQGYTLTPVTTVHVGEAATLTCALSDEELGSRKLFWYKQSAGETLKLIVMLWQKKLEYAPEFSESRLVLNYDEKFSNLTIKRATQEDEGMYHCATNKWIYMQWSGTYLLVKGNTQRTSNYSVVQWPTASDPGDPRTLQCSVLSDSENETCSGDHRVFWFRAGSDKSHPDIIYSDGNRRDGCTKRSDTQKSCVYNFSKNVSSSDDGTYYCAVATCGEILFGDGSKVEIVQTAHSVLIAVALLIVGLVISVVGNVVLICNRKVSEQCKGMDRGLSEQQHDSLRQPVHNITGAEDQLNYGALNFSVRNRKKKREFTEDSVYSQVTYN